MSNCINKEDLAPYIGRTLNSVTYDAMQFLVEKEMSIDLRIDGENVSLISRIEATSYFGEEERLSRLFVDHASSTLSRYETIYPEKVIEAIDIINETQSCDLGDVMFTRGVIFYFDEYEFSIEKSNVPYMCELYLDFGNHLVEGFDYPDYFFEHFEDYHPHVKRERIKVE